MGKRSGFTGVLSAMGRELARQQRAAEAGRRRRIREEEVARRNAVRESSRQQKELKMTQGQAEKEARRRYLEARIAEAEDRTSDLEERIGELKNVLEHTLEVDDSIDFASLRIEDEYPIFEPTQDLRESAAKPDLETFLRHVAKPRGLLSILPGAKKRYEQEVEKANLKAQAQFKKEQDEWELRERDRQNRIEILGKNHEDRRMALQRKKDQRNVEVGELEQSYASGDPDAIVAYNSMVLELSSYPDGFPQEFRLAYVAESKQLVVEYQLPGVGIVPIDLEYFYVKTKDEIMNKPRKMTEIRELYQDIISAVALRSIHEVLEADQGKHLATICFNGFVQAVDPATGQDIHPHLISVRTTRERFKEVDLARVDRRACLRNLGAQVSPRPAEAQPVKPIVEFDMLDKRFVDQSDVLGDLESRPNLVDLSPFEFEHLVANLFTQMGLETRLTRSSKDGGVDCVAFDSRPVLGGKIVIQAKRYSNTVGVSAVRDLYGTMMNEGANKGILVTTSGYGPDAFDFCKDKPIELIDGGGLLYLLQQTGVEARIIFPAERLDL